MARKTKTPTCRKHKASGQAIVTLTDSVSGQRKDVLLGKHDTQESRIAYARVLAEWEARGRRLDEGNTNDLTVAEVLLRFMNYAKEYYGKESKECNHFSHTIKPLTEIFPHKVARDLGPGDLKIVRQRMIDSYKWSRKLINRRIGRIRFIWKWAAEEGLIPATTWHGLQVVRGLLAGKTSARETDDRKPVSEELVAATLPHLPRHVAGLVRFMLLTGARPSEACQLRLQDIDTSDVVWIYEPGKHKNSWRGQSRPIGIGPESQKLLSEFTEGLKPEDYVFSPYRQREEIFASKRLNRKSKVQPSQINRKKAKAKKLPGERFRADSFAQAIRRTCKNHGLAYWCPYQLRHAAGIRARRAKGLDAAQTLLGHKNATMTEHYSKLDREDVKKVAGQIA